jgi:hypothetical protein
VAVPTKPIPRSPSNYETRVRFNAALESTLRDFDIRVDTEWDIKSCTMRVRAQDLTCPTKFVNWTVPNFDYIDSGAGIFNKIVNDTCNGIIRALC